MAILRMSMLLILLILATGLQAQGPECEDAIGCVLIGQDEPVSIGYMLVTSGAVAFLGEDSLGGIELALLAHDNQLLGRDIELLGKDSLCTPEGGQDCCGESRLRRAGAGHHRDELLQRSRSRPADHQQGRLRHALAFEHHARSYRGRQGRRWCVATRVLPHLAERLLLGEITARFAYSELGARSLATIHDGSVYAENLQRVMADNFVEKGGSLLYEGAINVGDTDMTAILTEVAAAQPDVLFFPIFEPEGNFIAEQVATMAGLEDLMLVSAGGLMVASFPVNSGEGAIGMLLSGPAVAGPEYAEFLELWQEAFGNSPPGSYHAHAFDATNILLDAIESVAGITEDGEIFVGREALRGAIAATTDFNGITGNLRCSPTGDCATGEAIGVFEIGEAEVFEANWPPELIWTPGAGALAGGP